MSKSDPNSAIFMEDTREAVEAKIKKSFCAPQIVEENPILDYCRHIIMPALGVLKINRKDGNSKTYTTYAELEADFVSGECHPGDLKPAVAGAINDLLQPVRDHFANDPYAKKLLETIRGWQKDIDAKKAAETK
jgi:tyrosyl-tRNA synthetase